MLRCPLHRRGLRALATLALLLLAPSSFAQTVKCGLFVNDADGSRLQLEAPDRGRELSDYDAGKAFALQSIDGQLSMVDLKFGLTRAVAIGSNGRELRVDDARYRLRKPAQCQAVIQHPEGSCLADPAGCMENLYTADIAQLEAGCEAGVPAMCRTLLNEYQRQNQAEREPSEEQAAAMKAALEHAFANIDLPNVCREDNAQFDETICLQMVEEQPELKQQIHDALVGATLAQGMIGMAMPQPPTILPVEHRQRLQGLCRQHPDDTFCKDVAKAQWEAGAYTQAVEALQLSCAPGGDKSACETVSVLQPLGDQLLPMQATALPCGDYATRVGLTTEMSFGDRGLVDFGDGFVMRGRIEDGAIRIKHDKGGDFILQPLPNGDLIGMDENTRFQRFQRAAGKDGQASCLPPVSFNEVPLPQDCPKALVEGGAEACCTAGSLQGCNIRGNQLALNGQWAQASGYYLKVCRAGVREGCENLVSAQENSSDVDAHGLLTGLCEADPSGRHVACDLLVTRNWKLMAFGRALEEALQDIDEQDAPPPRTSNHKQ